jgi:hypothetical protein
MKISVLSASLILFLILGLIKILVKWNTLGHSEHQHINVASSTQTTPVTTSAKQLDGDQQQLLRESQRQANRQSEQRQREYFNNTIGSRVGPRDPIEWSIGQTTSMKTNGGIPNSDPRY